MLQTCSVWSKQAKALSLVHTQAHVIHHHLSATAVASQTDSRQDLLHLQIHATHMPKLWWEDCFGQKSNSQNRSEIPNVREWKDWHLAVIALVQILEAQAVMVCAALSNSLPLVCDVNILMHHLASSLQKEQNTKPLACSHLSVHAMLTSFFKPIQYSIE